MDEKKHILLVDDNISTLTVGRNLLKNEFKVFVATSTDQMLEMLERGVAPELILLDIEMPEKDGFEAIQILKNDARYTDIPVIFLTAKDVEKDEVRGFELGAADYVSKPFSPSVLLKRIKSQLLIVEQNKTIQLYVQDLEGLVDKKTEEIYDLQNAIITTISDLIEFRDEHTGGHVSRTQLYMECLTTAMFEEGVYASITKNWNLKFLFQSTQLHDVGKIAIPDHILNKPGRLTEEEFDIMKTHVSVGAQAFQKIIDNTKDHAFLDHAHNIISGHHERWDGSGYMLGLKGEEIPLEGRLMAIVDVYDALRSWRPYKEPMTHKKAVEIIVESAGSHFDPKLVEVFVKIENQFEIIEEENRD